jgi:hypothetical protein
MARRLDKQRLILSAVLAVALGLILYGVLSAETGERAVRITDAAIEGVFPKPGDIVLRQSEVRVDLASGYRGILVIDGQEIPTFDLVATDGGASSGAQFDAVFDPALNTVSFTPKVGATIEAFAPDRHTVTAVYWKESEGRDAARQFTWTFRVS